MDDNDSTYQTRSFEEHFRPDARSDYSDLIQREELPKQEPKKEEKPKKGKNIVELLTGGKEVGDFARQLNLDPEMAEKMLVPLLSLLDKYGVGETVTASPRVEAATNAFEVIRDVAPVIKGAAEFIS
jgi:DNA-binding NarL/FixJ family response regulator